KLEGLFASRSGVNSEAAAQAVRAGLLEVVRTEIKGKTTIEWVRLTPRGTEFLHDQESPGQALKDLQAVLQVSRERVPLWLPELFTAVREKYPGLSVTDFHDRLRRLRDRHALHLVPFAGQPHEIQEPEYALLDGATLFYYATR